MRNILIIGAGPAGLTAAIYAVRYGYTATVFEGLVSGGQVATTFEVENYPAIERITGFELANKLHEQAVSLGVSIINEQVIGTEKSTDSKKVYTAKGEYRGDALIIATGAKRRKLNCAGEEDFLGKGVSYCATCDGNFFRKQEVALVGGGNTALEDALFLSNICKKVYLIHRKNSFRAISTLVNSVKIKPNIEIIYNSEVTAIYGEKLVESIAIKSENREYTLSIGGIFIAIGTEPDNGFLSGIIDLDLQGYIIADESCRTNVEGIFVAGDSRTKALRQIITATSDGGVAAFMAANYLSALD